MNSVCKICYGWQSVSFGIIENTIFGGAVAHGVLGSRSSLKGNFGAKIRILQKKGQTSLLQIFLLLLPSLTN